MSPVSVPSKTHRFMEIVALFTVVYPVFDGSNPPALWWDLTLAAAGSSAVLVGLGLVSSWARRASWLGFLSVGLMTLVVHPQGVEGPVLCLLSAFLLFDSGWFAGRAILWASLVGGVIVAAQVVGFFLVTGFSWISLARVLLTNGLFTVLAVLFRTDLARLEEAPPRPRLCLSSFDLTSLQLQILHLFWAGLSNKEIAVDLSLSEGTVRNHLSQMYRKFGVSHGKELLTLVHSHQVVFDESEPGQRNT